MFFKICEIGEILCLRYCGFVFGCGHRPRYANLWLKILLTSRLSRHYANFKICPFCRKSVFKKYPAKPTP
jgi:hypothetical protein